MTVKAPLAGSRVLVTRPRHQAQRLAELIMAAGGEPLLFPVLDIEFVPATVWPVLDWSAVDWLMFVSPNAVDSFCRQSSVSLAETTKLVAIGGETTAKAMQKAGLRVDLMPASASGSEGLIELTELQQMQQQQAVIVRGEGGRDLLADTLKQRGATIQLLEVYRRVLPRYAKAEIQQALTADKLMSTSLAGLENLMILLAEQIETVKNKPLVVFSERIRQYAIQAGFRLVTVTSDFSDEALVTALIEMDKTHGR